MSDDKLFGPEKVNILRGEYGGIRRRLDGLAGEMFEILEKARSELVSVQELAEDWREENRMAVAEKEDIGEAYDNLSSKIFRLEEVKRSQAQTIDQLQEQLRESRIAAEEATKAETMWREWHKQEKERADREKRRADGNGDHHERVCRQLNELRDQIHEAEGFKTKGLEAVKELKEKIEGYKMIIRGLEKERDVASEDAERMEAAMGQMEKRALLAEQKLKRLRELLGDDE